MEQRLQFNQVHLHNTGNCLKYERYFCHTQYMYQVLPNIIQTVDLILFVYICWNSIIRLSSHESVLTCVMNYELKGRVQERLYGH